MHLDRNKILAVVVTHNRAFLLSRCLDYLEHQVREADSIIVINNGSTDETETMLCDRGVRFITQENVGSAGGWHRGIQYAIDNEFDAVWLMDDDGYPESNALKHLEKAMEPGVSCVSSVVLFEDRPSHFVFPFPILNSCKLPVVLSRQRKISTLEGLRSFAKGGRYPFAHLFNGALISMNAIEKVGNVDRQYFLSGDELDYLYRIRGAGPVYSVLSAHHFHPDVTSRPFTSIKVYYYIKNTLILNRRYFDKVILRNVLTVVVSLFRIASRNGWREAIAYVVGGKRKVLSRAILNGLRGKLGKDFDARA